MALIFRVHHNFYLVEHENKKANELCGLKQYVYIKISYKKHISTFTIRNS